MSTFDDPTPPSNPKSKSNNNKPNNNNMPSYPGGVGKPGWGRRCPGTTTIDGQHQHTNPANATAPGIQFDSTVHTTTNKPPTQGIQFDRTVHTTTNKPHTPATGPGVNRSSVGNSPAGRGILSAGGGKGTWHYHHHDNGVHHGHYNDGGVWIDADDDNGGVIADGDVTATEQTRRFLRIKNNTGAKITVSLRYQTLNQDNEWVWNDKVLSYDFDAGETSLISDANWKINAVRARVWGVMEDGTMLAEYKDNDLWLVPEQDDNGNHFYLAPQMETHTLTFN